MTGADADAGRGDEDRERERGRVGVVELLNGAQRVIYSAGLRIVARCFDTFSAQLRWKHVIC